MVELQRIVEGEQKGRTAEEVVGFVLLSFLRVLRQQRG
jgi:hypothetical protein